MKLTWRMKQILVAAVRHPAHRVYGTAGSLDALGEAGLIKGPAGGSLVITLTPAGVATANELIAAAEKTTKAP